MLTVNQSSTRELHYTCIGEGADVLLIHGWVSSGRMWSRLMDGLGHQYRFWAVDLSGCGDSPLPERESSLDLDTHAAALIEFCHAHNLHLRAIVGHSMGGMLALKMAATQPDLMERLVLMSPVVTGRIGKWIELNRVITSDFGKFAMSRTKPLWTLCQSDVLDVFTPMLMMPWFTHRDAAVRIRQDFKRANWEAAAIALESIATHNMQPYLTGIPHPVLVVHGSRDTSVPPDEGRLAARLLPAGRLLELSSVYHQPLDETPGTVIDAIHDFLIEN